MVRILVSIMMVSLLISTSYAVQSNITESEGYACMGEDRTKRQTEETALQDAKRKAIEQVSTYIQSETQVKDFELQKDIVNAYANAKIRILEQKGVWDSEPPKIGDCYRLKIKAEVIPDEDGIKRISQIKLMDDPSAPLQVQLWTDKDEYKTGDKIKIYLKGNKPFYAVILYRDAKGELIQLLPNPYRRENYFNGGTTYVLPSGEDRFELEVTPPFGEEEIMVYASTTKPGELKVEALGAVYGVKTEVSEIGEKTRGVAIKPKGKGDIKAEEFFEIKRGIKTGGKR